MKKRLLAILACPKCRASLQIEDASPANDADAVSSGTLRCTGCSAGFPIVEGIPRFVPTENYADSFGYQWNLFKSEQLDSSNGTDQSMARFVEETPWSQDQLEGRWVLDAGCGAGRFLDVASKQGAEVVGVDISNAVDAARATLGDRDNIHLVQASIYELPFREGVFDGAYCIGVLQHTPDPLAALRSIPPLLKPEADLAVTIYERRAFTPLNGKYLVRGLTRRIPQRMLLRMIRLAMPILFPLTDLLFRIPILGKAFGFLIPVANYVEKKDLTWRQRYQWALLDTFDMLAPRYDQPQTETAARNALRDAGMMEADRTSAPGLNLIARKPGLADQPPTESAPASVG